MIRSPIAYPGGKFKALGQILPLIPEGIKEWREPFFGGGSVTLGYIQSCRDKPKRIIVGDLSTEIANFWQMVQKEPNRLTKEIELLWDKFDKENCSEAFMGLKTRDLKKINEIERAANLFLVSKLSFSALGYSGSVSKNNVSEFHMGRADGIRRVSEILKGVEIRNCEYEELLFGGDKDTFVFLDPPYYTQATQGLYGHDGDMHKNFQQEKFAEDCQKCVSKILITLDDNPYIRKLHKDMFIKEFRITYVMAGEVSESSLNGEEIFIANYDISGNGESLLNII